MAATSDPADSAFPGNSHQQNAAHKAGYNEQYPLRATQPTMLLPATGM